MIALEEREYENGGGRMNDGERDGVGGGWRLTLSD